MLIFILLIFMNNNLISAEDDESAENRYIEMLPEKEKREFLETVARRILEDVKSKEIQPGLVSGEITDDQLKVHSEYVTRLLKEETENLKRRNEEKNDTDKSNANSTKANVDARKSNKIVEKPIENVVSNSSSFLRDNGLSLEIDKSKQENKNKYIDLTLREGEKEPKEEDFFQSTTVTDNIQIIKDKVSYNDYNNSMKLALPVNVTKQDQVQNDNQSTDSNNQIDIKQGKNYSPNLNKENVTVRQGKNKDTNPSEENATEKDNTNKQVNNENKKNHKRKPISIEITFVNEDDEKENSGNSQIEKKNEVPVKVIYEKKEEEKEVSSTTNKAMITNSDQNKETNEKEQQMTYRKSLSEGIDENAQKIDQIVDNQLARKKRKSNSSDTDSESESTTKFGDVNETESSQNMEKVVNGSAEITTEQPNSTLTANTDLTSEYNQTLESTTESKSSYQDSTSNVVVFENITETPLIENVQTSYPGKENKRSHDGNPESTTAENDTPHTVIKDVDTKETKTISDATNYTNANITEISITEKLETTTLKKEVVLSHIENVESSTATNEVQHTVIDDFDANENDTFPGSTVTANYTGSTTEEIVKMRTKHISGYPEESNENTTTAEMSVVIISTTEVIENGTSLHISAAESNLNASFYARKLSDKDVNISFTKEKQDSNRSEISEPDKLRADHNDLITSTTLSPLTTVKIKQEEEIVAMEGPVEIKLDDVVLLKTDNLKTSTNINNSHEVSEKPLRQGFIKENNENAIRKIKLPQKEYLVYEILPGQEPFVKKESPDIIKKKLNPKSYLKLSKYKSNQSKSLYIENEQIAQTDQPKYAPVYNYAPENAYYNPKNKYGPNADDKNVQFVDERSNESENAEIENIFDYDIENDKNPPKMKQRSDQNYQIPKKESRETKENDGFEEDYYFGFLNKNTKENAILRTRIKDAKQWEKKIKCKGRYCHEPIATVIQDPLVPPNSDEPQHAHNAMLNKNPPVTHGRQVQSILADLGYFHHNHDHVHNLKCRHKRPEKTEYYHGNGESWIGANVDLLYTKKKVNNHKLLRSGGDRNVWTIKKLKNKLRNINDVPSLEERIKNHLKEDKESAKPKRVAFKIANHLLEKNRLHLKALNKTFNSVRNRPMVLLTGRPNPVGSGRISKYAFKKRPLFLLTGRHKGMSKHMNHKTPLILLTGKPDGNIKDRNEKSTLVLLTGRLDSEVKHGKREENINKKRIEMLLKDYDDVDKRVEKERSPSFEIYKDPDVGDSGSTQEAKSLKTLNLDVVNQIINMSQDSKDPSLQRKLIQKLKKTSNLYLPAENPIKKDYDIIEKQLWALALRSKSDTISLEPYVEVMTNMIASDNKALKKYDWLATTVDIRSAFTKLINLCDTLEKTKQDIHPKDLQLVKYMLYLYSSTQYLFDRENQKLPSNQRLSGKEPMKNTKQYKGNVRRRRHRVSRKYLQKPWLNKKGLKGMAADLRDFFEDLGRVLDDFHDAIKHIALVTNYRNQRWVENLKEVYLSSPPSRKQVLEIILHLESARLIGLIEESAANGLETNYVKYGLANPEHVDRAKEEFGFVVKLYLALKQLQ